MARGPEIAVKYTADTSGAKKGADAITKTGGGLKSWAKGAGAAIAGAFAVDKVKDFINAGAELQDQISASQAIFGKASSSVVSWSKTTDKSMGLSQAATLDAANTFATFGKAAGLTEKDLASFSGGLVGLAGDLSSFRGTSVEQATEAIGAALRGEAEPIRAYGVLLDDATLKARAMSLGLVKASGDVNKIKSAQLTAAAALKRYSDEVKKHGENSDTAKTALDKYQLAQAGLAKATKGTVPQLTQQQKVMAAQAEIFAQTSDAQGDFEKTSGSAANQQKILSAEMKNAQTAIGTALLPVLQKIIPYLESMAGFVEDNATWLVPAAAAVGVFALAIKVATAIQTLFNIQFAISVGWIALIVVGIAALIAGIILLVKNWGTVTAAFKVALGWIVAQWNKVYEYLSKPVGAAVAWIVGAFEKVRAAALAVWQWVKTNWPTMLAILTGPIGVAVLLISRNWDTIKRALATVYDWIRSTWHTLGGIITAPFRAAWDEISSIISAVRGAVAGVFSFVTETAGKIGGALKGGINTFIRGWNNLSFALPSVDTHIPGIGTVGGWSIDTPNIPELARGGVTKSAGLAYLHPAEVITPLARAGVGGNTYNIRVEVPPTTSPYAVGAAVVDAIRSYERTAGTAWRRTPGGR